MLLWGRVARIKRKGREKWKEGKHTGNRACICIHHVGCLCFTLIFILPARVKQTARFRVKEREGTVVWTAHRRVKRRATRGHGFFIIFFLSILLPPLPSSFLPCSPFSHTERGKGGERKQRKKAGRTKGKGEVKGRRESSMPPSFVHERENSCCIHPYSPSLLLLLLLLFSSSFLSSLKK